MKILINWLDWICLTTTHVLQDILAVLHRLMCLKSCFHSLKSCPIQVNVSQSCFHSLKLCKSQVLSRREHSTSRLCSIHHDIPVTMHTPAAYGQWSVFDHSGDKQSAVLGTRYGIWWPWYGQFEVGWLQPLQLWLGAGTSSVAPVLVSQDKDLCHVQIHPVGLNQLLNVGVDQWFHICIVDTCQWVYILVEGLFC